MWSICGAALAPFRRLFFSLHFADSPARLIEVSDFLLRFLWQVRKLAENAAESGPRLTGSTPSSIDFNRR
jgi:hypothetical protein